MANMMLHSKCDVVVQPEAWAGQRSRKSLVQLLVTHACRCRHERCYCCAPQGVAEGGDAA